MTGRTMTVELDDYTSAKLQSRAKAMGISPEDLLKLIVDARVFDYDDFTWIDGDPRDHQATHHNLQEEGRPWSEVRPEFLALIDKTFGEPE